MKANELRLNNYVLEDEQVVLLSTNYDLFKCLVNVDRGIGFEPIPLTEEWLLKFGFEKVGFQFIKDGIELFPIRDLYYRGNFPIKSDIKYVNQLQNLYFALTGEDLKLKADESKTD